MHLSRNAVRLTEERKALAEANIPRMESYAGLIARRYGVPRDRAYDVLIARLVELAGRWDGDTIAFKGFLHNGIRFHHVAFDVINDRSGDHDAGMRRGGRRLAEADRLNLEDVEPPAHHNGFAWIDADDEFEWLIRTLPKREQEIMRLRFIDGLSVREIGDRVGLASSRVADLIKRCLEILKYRMEVKDGLTGDAAAARR